MWAMTAPDPKEFIDFWIENSVHAREESGMVGSSQNVGDLTLALVDAAAELGISQSRLIEEVGDLRAYVSTKLGDVNAAEKGRRTP
jgi:hypothetical protein